MGDDQKTVPPEDFAASYYNLILERIAKHDGTPLPNGTEFHATMLMGAMFKSAKKTMRILTGELNARVYGTSEVINRASQFVASSDHKLEIIFENDIDRETALRHPLLTVIGRANNVRIWKLRPELQERIKSHFALMDDDSYRWEADKGDFSAIAAFGDKTFADKLSQSFELMKKFGSTELILGAPATQPA